MVFVTDPMCSWCWGMADSIKEIHEKYKDKIELDLMLGGTNTDSTDFVGDYGKKFLFQFEHHGLGTLATSSAGFQSI